MYTYADSEIYGNVLIGDPDPFFSTVRMYNLVDDLRSVIMYSTRKNGTDWEAWANELNEKFGILFLNPAHALTPERCRKMFMSTPLVYKAWRYNAFPEAEEDSIRTRAFDIATTTDDMRDIRLYNLMYNKEKSGADILGTPDNAPPTISVTLTTGGDK